MAQQGEGNSSSSENSSGDQQQQQQQQQQRQQESWWERLLRSLGYRPGENNDVGVIGAFRQGLSDAGRIRIPGEGNDIYMFGNRDSNNPPAPIFSDSMEGDTPQRQIGNRGDPQQMSNGDYYNFGSPNSEYNSMYESLYNSPNTGFAPRGDIGNGAVGGGTRFNQDRIPGENVGGGGGERQLTPPTSTEEPPPTNNDQEGSNSPPYQRRALNIPSLSILNNVPFPQFTGGVQGMPTYNTYDYPQYPDQQGGGSPGYQSALANAQANNPGQYGAPPSQGMQGMFNNLWNTTYGNNQDIYRGGQNPNLSRYTPQMFDLGGKPINDTQGQGGYSYNLPNSFGPFPQFNTNYGQGFGGMWGGMPWNQPDIYGQRLFNRQERMGQGIAVGEQNPNTPPGFPMNSKPAIDPYYSGKPEMNAPMGPVVNTGYFTGQQTDPTIPTMPVFSSR